MRRPLIIGTVAALGLPVLLLVAANWRVFDQFWTQAPGASNTGAETSGSGRRSKGQPPGIAVETALARSATTTSDIQAIGSLQSDEAVQIASEIAGRVAEVNFKEGQAVKEGDVLIKLDDSLARAEVADANARFNLASSNDERAKRLSVTGNVTEKARDEATANLETARAARELAKVRLDKHTIRAPFSGRVGIRKVSPGAFVGVGTAMVNLEKIDVLKVDFKLPERLLAAVKVGQTIELTVDALPGRKFSGEIYAIDPLVDVNGRALRLRARLPNPEMVLRPGLFARILVKGQEERKVVLVPESAVVPRGGENFVYRVDNDNKAVEVKVKLGGRKNAEVEIVEGLAPHNVVVTAGQQKLRDGTTVEVVENRRGSQGGKGG